MSFAASYKAIKTAVRWARRILDMVNETFDHIIDIAAGNLEPVGVKLEEIMHRAMPIVIGFLADQVGLGGVGQALRDVVDKLREKVDAAILWLIDKIKAGIEALIGAVKAGVKGLLKFFGVRELFEDGEGKSHAVYYEDQGGEPTLIVSSSPKPIREFLDFYVDFRNITSTSSKGSMVADIRNYLSTQIEPVIRQMKQAKRDGDTATEESKQGELLQKNTVLSQKLRDLMAGDQNVGKIIDSYRLEGMTGTYSSIPNPTSDQLTPDHQPQAAILVWAASESFFGSTSNMARRAAGRAARGYAINLHFNRHIAGRTYGAKGDGTKNAFISKANRELRGIRTNQEKRNVVVDLMKDELAADVQKMRDVADRSSKNEVWADIHALDISQAEKDQLIGTIKSNILAGENQIANQDLDSLKS